MFDVSSYLCKVFGKIKTTEILSDLFLNYIHIYTYAGIKGLLKTLT